MFTVFYGDKSVKIACNGVAKQLFTQACEKLKISQNNLQLLVNEKPIELSRPLKTLPAHSKFSIVASVISSVEVTLLFYKIQWSHSFLSETKLVDVLLFFEEKYKMSTDLANDPSGLDIFDRCPSKQLLHPFTEWKSVPQEVSNEAVAISYNAKGYYKPFLEFERKKFGDLEITLSSLGVSQARFKLSFEFQPEDPEALSKFQNMFQKTTEIVPEEKQLLPDVVVGSTEPPEIVYISETIGNNRDSFLTDSLPKINDSNLTDDFYEVDSDDLNMYIRSIRGVQGNLKKKVSNVIPVRIKLPNRKYLCCKFYGHELVSELFHFISKKLSNATFDFILPPRDKLSKFVDRSFSDCNFGTLSVVLQTEEKSSEFWNSFV